MPAASIDRKTLVMSNRAYLQGFFGGDKAKALNTYDMRIFGPEHEAPGYKAAIMDYLRGELGYRTDLNYVDLEEGYMPTPGPERRSTGSRWDYNHTAITPEMMAHMNAGGGPPASQPWLQNAMRQDPALKVAAAAGRYDSLNMCEGNLEDDRQAGAGAFRPLRRPLLRGGPYDVPGPGLASAARQGPGSLREGLQRAMSGSRPAGALIAGRWAA